MSINIDELKKALKNNPVFNMSLSGKEIFHSNVLAWLLLDSKEDDLSKQEKETLPKIFCPRDKNNKAINKNYKVLTVLREKNDFDLLIVYYLSEDKKQDSESMRDSIIAVIEDEDDEKKNHIEKNDNNVNETSLETFIDNCKFVVIENKFKAIPDASQLDRYYLNVCGWKINQKTKQWQSGKFIDLGKINGKKIQLNSENTTCYLLAPKKAKELFAQDSNTYSHDNKETGSRITVLWNLVPYEEVNEVIHKNMKTNYEPILENYYNFTNLMLKLSKDAVAVNENTKIYDFEKTVKQLKSIRIHDFYEKLWFSAIMSIIKQHLSEDVKNNLISEVGYSRGMGMLNFMYQFKDLPARYGIEIQNKQFRLAVYITNNKNKWKDIEDKSLQKEKYKDIFDWLFQLIPDKGNDISSITCDINGTLSYTYVNKNQKELPLGKFGEFKYIKFSFDKDIKVGVLAEKINYFLQEMKKIESKFNAELK